MTERIIEAELTLDLSLDELWKCWTTKEGITSFFAPDCNVCLEPWGDYEIYFFPENPPGFRGADGQRILAFEPMKMLSFSWNFPPQFKEIREHSTVVILRFIEGASVNQSKLIFRQLGFGDSPVWRSGFEYFESAWKGIVFARLLQSIKSGPIDWTCQP